MAKLKAKMDQQKAEEERIRQEQEEEDRRFREEQRLAEEQRKFEEAQKKLEKERQKEEERVQKKAEKVTEKNDALERMRASGFIVPDVEKIRQETKDQKPVYQKVKKHKAAAHVDPSKTQATVEEEEEEEEEDVEEDGEVSVATMSDTEIDEDDWEAVMEQEERREERHKNNIRIREGREEKKRNREEARAARKEAKRLEKEKAASMKGLRSPICCVLGHVDTGKTSLLDRIRRSNVQGGEAGGITQQIGATFFPAEGLHKAVGELTSQVEIKVPGLLVIDTPGHESFTNLRVRGSSICDLAILVVDIMHGLENQTRESIRLLREQRCPFIIALNKVDRLFSWKAHEDMDIQQSLALQNRNVQVEFETRTANVLRQLGDEGLNAALYYENDDKRNTVSIVPTSAHTGEGICDLLMLEIKLVQEFMKTKVTLKDELQCTVLEVKPIPGLGFTIDVILINGELHEGDNICLCGQTGPIFTQIRSLLNPQPMKEIRVKGTYVRQSVVKAAMGTKICANDLEFVVPGTSLVVYKTEAQKEEMTKLVMSDSTRVEEMISPDGMGVTVQSSTLGALEALLKFLGDMKIPVGSVAIGPIQKRHLYHATAMKRKDPRYSIVLAFDVTVSDGAREMAEKEEIEIFSANIIYHLFDAFTRYNSEYDEREKEKLRNDVIFPVQMLMCDDCIHATNPIIIPVKIQRGQLRVGTPLCVMHDTVPFCLGKVVSMEKDGKPIDKCLPGMEVAVKIHSADTTVVYGRHFNNKSEIVSLISRRSVNAIKKFKDEVNEDDINLLATLIKLLKVPKE